MLYYFYSLPVLKAFGPCSIYPQATKAELPRVISHGLIFFLPGFFLPVKKKSLKIILIAGARPNFMKIAPLVRAIESYNKSKRIPRIRYRIIHTGQHYDYEMSKVFFQDLDIPEPDIYLNVGSGSHAEQTGRTMVEMEKALRREKPDLIVVVGDVNSTLASALVTAKIIYPNGGRPLLAHVEAGLRSFDRRMPEEINRLLTDQVSDFLFTTSEEDNENLVREGISGEKIFPVGNIMIDNLLLSREKADRSPVLKELSLAGKGGTPMPYAVLTLHRASNVDSPETLKKIIRALKTVSRRIPVIFPAHPRTKKMIGKLNLTGSFSVKKRGDKLSVKRGIYLIEPLGYLDFLKLVISATLVLTDSGGIQAEAFFLGIPCLTLRDTTEWPVTLKSGANRLVGNDKERIIAGCTGILKAKRKKGGRPKLWDGKTAERIVEVMVNETPPQVI